MPAPAASPLPRPRVAVLTRALPTYRHPLYLEILRQAPFDFRIFCEDIDVGDALRTSPPPPPELPVTLVPAPGYRRRFWNRTGVPLPALDIGAAVRRYRPDVAIMEGLGNIGTDLLCLPRFLMRGTPFVWWTLGDIPETRHTLKARLGRPLQRWMANRAGAILAYSSYAIRVLEEMGVERGKMLNTMNTLDEREILRDIERCAPRVPALRAELNLGGRPVVVFCGTVLARKRLDLLLRAWPLLAARAPAPVLLVVGDGPALPEARALASELCLGDAVRFVGRQTKDVSAYLSLGNLLVLPGLGGLAINHAFAHGLPVICGRADGCEEDLVHTGQTGIRLDSITPETLAAAMDSALNDPAALRAMGERARRRVTETVTLAHFAATVIESVRLAAASRRR